MLPESSLISQPIYFQNMKTFYHTIALLTLIGMGSFNLKAAPSSVTETTCGSQYIWQDANTTNIIAPEFQPASVGIFVVTSVLNNGTNATLTLAGSPPVDTYGAPLTSNEFQYSGTNQPNTYYALVCDGTLKGIFFTVVSNTTNALTINTGSTPMSLKSIKSIELRPYWTLATLFPADMATNSFIPTTNTNNLMSTVLISTTSIPSTTTPQSLVSQYCFLSSMSNWVNVTNASVYAGDTIVPPGQYVYFRNNGGTNTNSMSYPLNNYIAGTILTNLFRIPLAQSTFTNSLKTTYFALPRSSSYTLSKIGFNDSNFKQSTNSTYYGRNDLLLVDNGHGNVAVTYYKYMNKWYSTSNTNFPVNPTFAPGTVFGVLKAVSVNFSEDLINTNNIH
jgi:uncharacterized protein (TIGR02597 family)